METKNSIFIDLLQTIVIALAICVILYLFVATPNEVLGRSMEPTFHEGNLLLTNKMIQYLGTTSIAHNYQRGDIVIFKDRTSGDDFIKRVIGLPGDKVKVENGKVYVNDELLNEAEYLSSSVTTQSFTFLEEGVNKTVPADSYIVFGDNRPNSKDSRTREVGFVKREQMKGKVFLQYWPLDTFHLIQRPDYSL